MKKVTLLTGLTVAALAGCGELKKVDDMHDSTVKMSKTTSEMNETTGQMNKVTSQMNSTTSQMNKTTSEMNGTTTQMRDKMISLEQKTEELKQVTNELYDTLRQGNALQLRREAYDSILKAPTMFKKISEASKYFMSFELQIWNALGQDLEPGKRELLGQQEAQEFFLEVEELAPRDNSVKATAMPDPKDIMSDENRAASFNAMAVSIHQINRKEVRSLKMNPGSKYMNMYTMIEEALSAPRNEPQTGYIREVMAHEDKAIQLLQTRLNVFPLIFIDVVSKLSSKNKLEQAKMALIGWDFDMDSLSATQLEYLQTEVLGQALDTKMLLKKIGKKTEMDSMVVRLLNKMNIKSNAKKSTAVAASQTQLLAMIKELQKN